MNRFARIGLTALALSLGVLVTGCEGFDPTSFLDNDFFNTKKRLPGERKPVFPEGTPGVTQGVPKELVKGYEPAEQAQQSKPQESQPTAQAEPAEPKPEAKAEAKPKPKPKPKVVAKPKDESGPTAVTIRPSQELQFLSVEMPRRPGSGRQVRRLQARLRFASELADRKSTRLNSSH